jgi:hypothetical protein
VKNIYSVDDAFAAITEKHLVIAWGSQSVPNSLKEVKV